MPENQGVLVTIVRLHNGEEVKIFNLCPFTVEALMKEGGDELLLCVDGNLKEVSLKDIARILGEGRTPVRFIDPEFLKTAQRQQHQRNKAKT